MTYLYRYIFSADLPRYLADGWELCGPMKGSNYRGWYSDTVIIRRHDPPLTTIADGGTMGVSNMPWGAARATITGN